MTLYIRPSLFWSNETTALNIYKYFENHIKQINRWRLSLHVKRNVGAYRCCFPIGNEFLRISRRCSFVVKYITSYASTQKNCYDEVYDGVHKKKKRGINIT